MIDFSHVEKQINEVDFFQLAQKFYNKLIEGNAEISEELPEDTKVDSLIINNKSISVLLYHKNIKCPSIEVCLELSIEGHILPIGNYHLIVDKEKEFIDEYLIFN